MDGTEGRALHLLDVEYLGLGPQVTGADLALVLNRYRVAVDWHLGDHILGIVADAAHEGGVQVWAAAYSFNLARSLAQSVDVVATSPSPTPSRRDSSRLPAPARAHCSAMSDPRIAVEPANAVATVATSQTV